MIKVTKVELRLNEPDKELSRQILRGMSDIQYMICRALNKCMTFQYADTNQKLLSKDLGVEIPKDNDRFGKSMQAFMQDVAKSELPTASANIYCTTAAAARAQFKKDKDKGLLKGSVSLSTFKRSAPIKISGCYFKFRNEHGRWYVKCPIFNKVTAQDMGLPNGQIEFEIVKPKGDKKETIQRIACGEYKLSESCISKNDKGKWMLSLSCQIEQKVESGNNVLGVDIGLHNMIALAVYDPRSGEYERMSYKEALVGYEMFEEFGKQIKSRTLKAIYQQGNLEEYRENMFRKRKSFGIASKLSDGGKGYRKKNKKLLSLRSKEKNFRDTRNHQLSRYIVDEAVKHNCGVIQIEDLSGITDTSNRYMKSWPYYDLQTKIIYKAQEKGIEVIKIDPKYTSRRCSYCGNINMDINNTSIHKWQCPTCGEEHNRDINAAKNIALPEIESIIKEHLKLIEPKKVG